MMLDRRLNVFRSDLADEKLQGVVQAERFVSGSPAQIAVPVIGLRPTPDLAAGIDTELLSGESVLVFDRANGWAWVQADADGYAGYVRRRQSAMSLPSPTGWLRRAPSSIRLQNCANRQSPPFPWAA